MSIHNKIMNIRTPEMPTLPLVGGAPAVREALAYKVGHRDARHAAAELAAAHDALMQQMAEALVACVVHGEMTGDEWVAEKAHAALRAYEEQQ